jgi:tetratricopeptide repeat protein 30
MIKALEPYDRKLGLDTWYYAKRCLLALAEGLAKHMVSVRDGVLDDAVAFLDEADRHGKKIVTVAAAAGDTVDPAKHNVSAEARQLKKLFLKLRA